MKWTFTSFFLTAFLFSSTLAGQVTCTYRVELYDSGGDGWSNASLTLFINGEPSTFTLNGFSDNGASRVFEVEVMDGDTAVLQYRAGFDESENSYAIFGPEGNLILNDGPFPQTGTLPAVILSCPSCPAPSDRSITVDDVRDDRVDISWVSQAPEAVHVIEYGATGFEFGTGRRQQTMETMIRISGLSEKTAYDFYLFSICGAGDTSSVQGPFPFETLWAKDVGISQILEPLTACGLGVNDTVRVGLTNFGGDPQTLIPFRYAVNGVPVQIPDPFDGLFTGVVGNDSTSFIDFETTFDFSEPGEYVITSWTELEGDQDVTNDTTSVTVTNIPIISTFPYFENFESWPGGWTVDSSSTNPSWAYGRPDGIVINRAASGENAWVTNLEGSYNAGENSYLLSPCLDFSSLTEDPRISFSLFFVSEACCDYAWMEVSTDGGGTWEKVGEAGTGLNWYNNEQRDVWSGDAGNQGWRYAFNTLEGTAGASDVRVRFVFFSDNGLQYEGFGIDNVFISTPLTNDLAAVEVSNATEAECGAPDDRVQLTLTNFGTATQTGFDVGYRVDGGTPVIENVGDLSLAPNEQATYTFNTTFSSEEARTFEIVGWADLNNDQFRSNDTIRFEFSTARSLPFVEDFEDGIVPEGWDAGDAIVSNTRNNISFVLTDNLFLGDQDLVVTTPVIGPLAEDDSLTFDYRFTLQAGGGNTPKVLVPGERLEVQISTDCGESYSTVRVIDETNHTPSATLSNVTVQLGDFAGQTIKIRFLVTWAAGDWWADLDNINLLRCPNSLQLEASVVNESASGTLDGSATIIPNAGVAPFSYEWSTGDTIKTISKVGAGTYEVTVTDRFGCTDVASVEVGVGVGIDEIGIIESLSLAPNPTSGQSRLTILFMETADVQVQVVNAMGQVLSLWEQRRTRQVDYYLDLDRYSNGLYFIRIVANEQLHTERLLLID